MGTSRPTSAARKASVWSNGEFSGTTTVPPKRTIRAATAAHALDRCSGVPISTVIAIRKKPTHNFVGDLIQAAIELHAGAAEAGVINPLFFKEFAHRIVVRLFAAMFEQQCAANERMAEVA